MLCFYVLGLLLFVDLWYGYVMMNNHCTLAQVVDVVNYKDIIYSCCPNCGGRVFWSCERYEWLLC